MQAGLAQSLIQMGGHGLQLALHLAGRDDQAVRVIGAACDIQHQNVFGLVVFQAFAGGFHQGFQAVERQFFAALAARAADARRGGLGFAIGFGSGGFRLGRGFGGSRLGCGLGGCALWCWLGRGGFGGRLWRGSLGLWRSFRLGRGGGFGLGSLGLWRGIGLRLSGGPGLWRGIGFRRCSGFGRGGCAALWAFFSRGGFAGYGRLLCPYVTGAALPP